MFSHGVCLADDLEVNEEIIVTWMPNRTCRFRYLGNKRFVVVESVNAQISVGDTFTCHHFINGETLSIVQLTHKGKCGLTYVAGKLGGIHFKRVLSRMETESEKK